MKMETQTEIFATYGAALVGVMVFVWSISATPMEPEADEVCQTLDLRPTPITQCAPGN